MLRNILAVALLCLGSACVGGSPALAYDKNCNVTMPCEIPEATTGGFSAAPVTRHQSDRADAPAGLRATLAAKVADIEAACPGTRIISGLRHTFVAGTNRISLHASGKAADLRGPYGCIYSQLRGWPGGYSVDPGIVHHIHVSYDPEGGREMGIHFHHHGHRHHGHRHRHASK